MKKKLDIPSPITGGPLELCSSKETITFRGEEIPYEKKFYRCVESGAEFADDKLEKENLKRRRGSLVQYLPIAKQKVFIPSTSVAMSGIGWWSCMGHYIAGYRGE